MTKTPIPNPGDYNSAQSMIFDAQEHSRHILFCGTKVIQTRFYEGQRVRAVVLQTGERCLYSLSKMVADFPPPVFIIFCNYNCRFV